MTSIALQNQQLQQQAFSLVPRNFSEAMEFSKVIASSDLAPRDYKNKPANVLVAVAMGSELGLSPMQSLQNIAVINGRPSVWGDAMLAICRGHRDFEDIQETIEGAGDDRVATCVVKRRGQSPTTSSFSVKEATKAGLWGKAVWAQYPERMLKMRARGFALRDAFADALKGIISTEEAKDIATHEVQATVVQMRQQEPVTQQLPRRTQTNRDKILQATEPMIETQEASAPVPIAENNGADLRRRAMTGIGAAAEVSELHSVGEWIKTSDLEGKDLEDVREQYKRKMQFLKSIVDEPEGGFVIESERVQGEDDATEER